MLMAIFGLKKTDIDECRLSITAGKSANRTLRFFALDSALVGEKRPA